MYLPFKLEKTALLNCNHFTVSNNKPYLLKKVTGMLDLHESLNLSIESRAYKMVNACTDLCLVYTVHGRLPLKNKTAQELQF